MQNQEQQLIDNLFNRLKQAESQGGARDAGAEQLIQQHLQRQPGAPYYMSQAILIQEAALKKLNAQVSELENRLAQAQQQPTQQQSSGGFLSGLFGGGSRPAAQPQPAWNNAPPPQSAPPQAAAPARGTGFLGGALQTAVGVAGGVVMADMLTSMFHHSQPDEIVNIINEPALPQVDNTLDTFNGNDSNNAFLNDQSGWDNNLADNNDFGDFGSGGDFDDDDSFV